MFKSLGIKLSGYVINKKVEMTPQSAYYIGWQLLHLLEAVHSHGYTFNNLSFSKINFNEQVHGMKIHDINVRDFSFNFQDFSLATPFRDPETGKHLK